MRSGHLSLDSGERDNRWLEWRALTHVTDLAHQPTANVPVIVRLLGAEHDQQPPDVRVEPLCVLDARELRDGLPHRFVITGTTLERDVDDDAWLADVTIKFQPCHCFLPPRSVDENNVLIHYPLLALPRQE